MIKRGRVWEEAVNWRREREEEEIESKKGRRGEEETRKGRRERGERKRGRS